MDENRGVTPDSTPGPTTDQTTGRPPGPLAGIRVLDLTRVLSGPHCTRMLADMGADVIKAEPPAGDLTRFSNPRVNSLATYFVQQNVGKRNISLDMNQPAGVDLLRRLATVCDVLIENFRPGVMERMGLGPEVLLAGNPRLIYASINGYGSTGPWTGRRAYAPVVGAEAGFTKAQGDSRAATHGTTDGHVQHANDPHSNADVYTALECASAILAALFQRERTGQGQRVEVSMAETMLYVNEHGHDHLFDRDVPPEWIRSFQPGDYPVLTVADGTTVVISGHPAERGTFDRFVSAMDRPDLLTDPRFADVPSRLAHLPELTVELEAWAATVPDADTFETHLAQHELAMGVLRSYRELAETDWARARHAVVEVSDRGDGVIRVPNSPWRFSKATTGVTGEPRYRGEDNRTVLAELLELTDADLDRLESDGVLVSRLPR